MDQQTAKRLMQEGAIFILLDVPIGTEFGIDMKSWNTGENFRGVKMIPPGVHYVFYSSVSRTGDAAPRSGFIYNFKKAEVVVRKWDRVNENISLEDVPQTEIVSFKNNITLLDKFLGPYPYDILETWKSFTSNITQELYEKLIPLNVEIKSALELMPCNDLDRPRGRDSGSSSSNTSKRKRFCVGFERNDENDLLPHLKPKSGTELRFTQFPEKSYPDGITPAEITQHCLDLTYVLDQILSSYSQTIDIIGEIEFAYVCFLVGHSLEAFEQWKKLVILLCSCQLAIKKYRYIYNSFITLLEHQVKEIPEELLADIVTNNNFVYVNLRKLFRAVRGSDVDGRLKTKTERFQEFLTDSYMWDFTHLDSDEEDEQPVIVEI